MERKLLDELREKMGRVIIHNCKRTSNFHALLSVLEFWSKNYSCRNIAKSRKVVVSNRIYMVREIEPNIYRVERLDAK